MSEVLKCAVKLRGLDCTDYDKSPVVYFNHNMVASPIGKVLRRRYNMVEFELYEQSYVDLFKGGRVTLGVSFMTLEDGTSRLIELSLIPRYANV